LERGVSRRHVEIRSNERQLLLVDLGSTNGTRLNGYRLRPHEPYRLRHGDLLEVGLAELRIQFTMVPVHDGVKAVKKVGTGILSNPDEDTTAGEPRRILVVQSETEVAEALYQLLDGLGYAVTVVNSTADAMRVIATRLPHAVFLDFNMPDFSGIEVCRMIRNDLSSRELPIFVLSTDSGQTDVQMALEAGANLFLSKPVGLNELLQALNTFVGDPIPRSQK
jgi:CheY-like chemotaxis protein